MKIQNGQHLEGTYSNGINTWAFSGVVESIHHDTAGGNFSTARIILDMSFDNRNGIMMTLVNGEMVDDRYTIAPVATTLDVIRIIKNYVDQGKHFRNKLVSISYVLADGFTAVENRRDWNQFTTEFHKDGQNVTYLFPEKYSVNWSSKTGKPKTPRMVKN